MNVTKVDDDYNNQEISTDLQINDDSLPETIFDFSLDIKIRIQAIERFYELFREQTVELMNRLTGMYQFSGTKVIEKFLIKICKQCSISPFLKLEACKSLLYFSEEEEIIKNTDNESLKEIKIESNEKIKERNKIRKIEAYKSLDCVCYCLEDLPSPCKVEAVCYLMECEDYKRQSLLYFCEIINDPFIECDFRYKAIISIEEKKSRGPEKYNIKDREYYLKNSFLEFLNNENNMTMYRILAGQYLLQKLNVDAILSRKVQNTLLSFARDDYLDINLRADAADTLLNLGEKHIKDEARGIIMTLGRLLGGANTIFNNAQNVHVTEVEESVKEILGFLTSFPTLEINKVSINFDYVNSQIQDIIKKQKEIKIQEINTNIINTEFTGFTGFTGTSINCTFCLLSHKENEIIDIQDKKIDGIFYCSEKCFKENDRIEKMIISLNRINIDRILYSKYNQTLSNILIKVWSFLSQHESKHEIINRLLEELYDMSGTCSSGFASRLVNIISGFSDYNIKISFTDQIIANFIARLNASTRKITESDSIYFREKHRDIILLYMKNNKLIDNKINNIDKDKIIDDFLKDNKQEKINLAVQDFSDNVILEMLDSDNYENRPSFIQFFCDTMPIIRQELYEEFKHYVSDYEFDLSIRSGISSYEGVEYLI